MKWYDEKQAPFDIQLLVHIKPHWCKGTSFSIAKKVKNKWFGYVNGEVAVEDYEGCNNPDKELEDVEKWTFLPLSEYEEKNPEKYFERLFEMCDPVIIVTGVVEVYQRRGNTDMELIRCIDNPPLVKHLKEVFKNYKLNGVKVK